MKKFFAGLSFLFLALNLIPLQPSTVTTSAQTAPFEPDCQTITTSPTFNPYPITTSNPNPTYSADDCKDIPMLSFFAINTANNNPREINVSQNQNITFELYYNNGATAGSAAIQNPRVKIMVNQASPTKYCISATLSGNNATSVTSAQKGGDICMNTPANTRLNIVGNTTTHFPDADERRYESETTGRSPSDQIADNSSGNNVSNPIYMAFPGTQLSTTSGYQFKNQLEAGFLGYGYILSQIVTSPAPAQETNLPPSVPGQEITILRGESESFDTIIGSDPDNNTPLSYSPNDLPSFCSYNSTSTIINCQSNETTPIRSTFTVTPTDSKGLSGTPGTFIVNIIEPTDPNLSNSQKICVVFESTTPCNSSELTTSDQVTYAIEVKTLEVVSLKM
ncbi:MAG: hypothetical protein HC932_01460 [Thermales bacterium]|nr:hypothetical protein [Thermales bacterium]